MKKSNNIAILTSVIFSIFALPISATTEFDTEDNNSFLTSQYIDGSSGDITILGDLAVTNFDASIYDYVFTDTLSANVVYNYVIANQTAGETFVAWIDNDLATNTFSPDTLLSNFDEASNIISTNDDSSPIGDGFASSIIGEVNQQGNINLAVTGYNDFDFLGNHTQSGDYSLFVSLSDRSFGDLDFFTIDNLVAGDTFNAEIIEGEIDSVLGLFDESGNLIISNDEFDIDSGLFSKITGIVPESGMVTLAVSAYDDQTLIGNHSHAGTYSLNVSTIPVPASIWLMLSGLGVILGLHKRSLKH